MKIETLLKIRAWERAYKESGDEFTIVDLIQELIDTGEIQEMPDCYQVSANKLIEHGYCHRPKLRTVK